MTPNESYDYIHLSTQVCNSFSIWIFLNFGGQELLEGDDGQPPASRTPGPETPLPHECRDEFLCWSNLFWIPTHVLEEYSMKFVVWNLECSLSV